MKMRSKYWGVDADAVVGDREYPVLFNLFLTPHMDPGPVAFHGT